MSELLSVDEALRLIEQRCAPLAPRTTPLADALGLALGKDIASDIDSPPHDKAMMDGFAVRSGDGLAERRIIEEVFAGDVPTAPVGAGEATRIMTGAPMPEGADAVVPVEQTEATAASLRLTGDPPLRGKHVMAQAASMRAGQIVLRRGALVRAAETALLAEVGAADVPVVPAPTVAVLSTGAELVPVGETPRPGQIRNSNGPMLLSAVREAGAIPVDAGVATDDPRSLAKAIEPSRDADVLLLSGGVSAGDRDFAPQVLGELGVEKVFHKVAVKPGKPLWFGVWQVSLERKRPGQGPTKHTTYVFGLPGNPVSSFVCFQLFVRPLLAALAGRGFQPLPEVEAPLRAAITHRGGRETFLPADLNASGVESVPWKGSADLAGLVSANALIRLPKEPVELQQGQPVRALRLSGSTP